MQKMYKDVQFSLVNNIHVNDFHDMISEKARYKTVYIILALICIEKVSENICIAFLINC